MQQTKHAAERTAGRSRTMLSSSTTTTTRPREQRRARNKRRAEEWNMHPTSDLQPVLQIQLHFQTTIHDKQHGAAIHERPCTLTTARKKNLQTKAVPAAMSELLSDLKNRSATASSSSAGSGESKSAAESKAAAASDKPDTVEQQGSSQTLTGT